MAHVPEVVVADLATLQRRLRAELGAAALQATEEGRRWSLAVPGGSVADRLLVTLHAGDAAWSSADLFWCDERAVPHDDLASNAGSARRGWLRVLERSGLRSHPMAGEVQPLADAARRYEGELVAALGAQPVLDVAVVGVGEDGHVCSLFPGHAALELTEPLVTAVEDAPKPPPRRLTLTLPFVARSRRLVIAAFGEGKRSALREALGDAASPLPVARLLRMALGGTTRVVVLLDPPAAGAPAISYSGR